MKIPVKPPAWREKLVPLMSTPEGSLRFLKLTTAFGFGPTLRGKYRHWDTFRHLPFPDGVTPEEAWIAVKIARTSLYKQIPLTDTSLMPFQFSLPGVAIEMLHHVDHDAAGSIKTPDLVTDPSTRDTYLIKSLVEEAITSSQLEGASTTRRVAKAMIQEGREPRTRSERMIANNYTAMSRIRQFIGQPLTTALVLELQAILTAGTLDEPNASGRLRRPDEPIVVEDEVGTLLHVPPKADQLQWRMDRMCAFANGEGTSAEEFIHPVVRSILLHFWLAYDHPFVDGNGRTARALFYWSMARHGYWLSEYVSISRILKKAKAQYARAFLYSENDENDATYFLLFQLRVLQRAIVDLHTYLAKKAAELKAMSDRLLRTRALGIELNSRQLAITNHALKNPGARYTFLSHRRSHGISYETARTDLLELSKLGLLEARKVRRAFNFFAPEDLEKRLLNLARQRRKAMA